MPDRFVVILSIHLGNVLAYSSQLFASSCHQILSDLLVSSGVGFNSDRKVVLAVIPIACFKIFST